MLLADAQTAGVLAAKRNALAIQMANVSNVIAAGNISIVSVRIATSDGNVFGGDVAFNPTDTVSIMTNVLARMQGMLDNLDAAIEAIA